MCEWCSDARCPSGAGGEADTPVVGGLDAAGTQRSGAAVSGGRIILALLAGLVGGLLLAGSTTGEWFAIAGDRDVGGVPVPGGQGLAGGRVASELLPLGLAAGAVSLALAVIPGRGRRAAGGLLVLLAGGSLWPIVRPFVGGAPGEPASGLAVAIVGAALVAVAGALALRAGSPPGLSARYDLDVDDADDEWHLAADDDPEES